MSRFFDAKSLVSAYLFSASLFSSLTFAQSHLRSTSLSPLSLFAHDTTASADSSGLFPADHGATPGDIFLLYY